MAKVDKTPTDKAFDMLRAQADYEHGAMYVDAQDARLILRSVENLKKALASWDGSMVEYKVENLYISLPREVDPTTFGKVDLGAEFEAGQSLHPGTRFWNAFVDYVDSFGGTIGGHLYLLRTEEEDE